MERQPANAMLSAGGCATLACLLEATAAKPGNVHRGADFEDLTFFDLAASAVAIAPAVEAAATGAPLGQSILKAVRETQALVRTNTNLGIVLLIVPLAKACGGGPLEVTLAEVLDDLGPADAAAVYEAIRLANPGGLGRVRTADVSAEPPRNLLEAMRLAADRDLVARQYVNRFAEVRNLVLPTLLDACRQGWALADAIVYAHVSLLAAVPDSLIARKCGPEVAQVATARAGAAIEAGGPGDEGYQLALADLDFWLRSDGHRRNPGTTADLITAGLYLGLREGSIAAPLDF